jgi:hypothetical protein
VMATRPKMWENGLRNGLTSKPRGSRITGL